MNWPEPAHALAGARSFENVGTRADVRMQNGTNGFERGDAFLHMRGVAGGRTLVEQKNKLFAHEFQVARAPANGSDIPDSLRPPLLQGYAAQTGTTSYAIWTGQAWRFS